MKNFEILLLYHCAQRLSPRKKAVTFEACGGKKFLVVRGKFELKKLLRISFLHGWQREAMERTFIHSRMFAMPCKALIQSCDWILRGWVTHCFALTAKWASTVQSQCRSTLLMFSHPKSEASSFFRKRAKKGRLECPAADKRLSSCLVFSFFACLF